MKNVYDIDFIYLTVLTAKNKEKFYKCKNIMLTNPIKARSDLDLIINEFVNDCEAIDMFIQTGMIDIYIDFVTQIKIVLDGDLS